MICIFILHFFETGRKVEANPVKPNQRLLDTREPAAGVRMGHRGYSDRVYPVTLGTDQTVRSI